MAIRRSRAEPRGAVARPDPTPQPVPRWRYRLALVLVVATVGVLGARAVDLQVVSRDFMRTEAEARHVRTIGVPAHRGVLTDRNGEALAVSSPVKSVWAEPSELLDDAGAIERIAELLERPPGAVQAYLEARSEREFVYLRRHVHPDLADAVASAGIAGVNLQREYRRFYPSGEVSAQLLGVTDIDDRGLEGLERSLDQRLRGVDGAKRVLRDRLGRVIEDIELLREPRAGQDTALSIDRRLQYLTYRELKHAVQRHGAETGAAVLLDVQTGEILALASQPSFNPHRRTDVDPAQRRNRGIADAHEPGSVIKPFTAAAALRAGAVEANTVLDTAPGTMQVGGHEIRDIRDYGALDLTGVIQKSSNVGAAKVALETPPRALWDTLNDFGFGAGTESGLPGEARGHLDPAPPRRDVARATLAYGYGMTATPVQLVRAYAALANGGEMPSVTLLRRDDPGEHYPVLESEYAEALVEMLEHVVRPGGTGVRAAVPGYRVAGKTGTVRKSVAGGYAEDAYVATFVGFAPVSDPRLALAVVVDDPAGDAYYGGEVAAPVFSNVMTGALRLMNVPPDDLPGLDEPILAERPDPTVPGEATSPPEEQP